MVGIDWMKPYWLAAEIQGTEITIRKDIIVITTEPKEKTHNNTPLGAHQTDDFPEGLKII